MTLQDKQVDHLILLVGGNPLPNAVTGNVQKEKSAYENIDR